MASKDNPFPAKNPKGRPEYWTIERIAELEATLWAHVNDPASHDVLGWRGKQRITRATVNDICRKSPDFRDSYEEAKALLGSKRQENALNGIWKEGVVKRDDWNYDEDLKAHDEELRREPIEEKGSLADQALNSKLQADNLGN